MRRSDSDLMGIPERELRTLSQDELVRLVVICRDGDESNRHRGKAAWTTLVASDYDRIRNLVVTYTFPDQANVRVDRDDIDDVVQQAYERLAEKLFESFRGASRGEYKAAAKTCIYFECMDHCRAKMKDEQHRAGSLDETVKNEDGDSRGRFDQTLADQEREALEQEEIDRIAQQVAREQLKDIFAALDQFPNQEMAETLRLTWQKKPVKEIMAELGISQDLVYAHRSRGMKLLKKIFDDDGEADDKTNGDE